MVRFIISKLKKLIDQINFSSNGDTEVLLNNFLVNKSYKNF